MVIKNRSSCLILAVNVFFTPLKTNLACDIDSQFTFVSNQGNSVFAAVVSADFDCKSTACILETSSRVVQLPGISFIGCLSYPVSRTNVQGKRKEE